MVMPLQVFLLAREPKLPQAVLGGRKQRGDHGCQSRDVINYVGWRPGRCAYVSGFCLQLTKAI